VRLSPRIRDLGRITLYRTSPKPDAEAAFPLIGPLLTCRANPDLISARWDFLLRLAGSLKFGHATASLLVGKLSGSGRQNALAAGSRSTAPCAARSTPPATSPTRRTGARSPAN